MTEDRISELRALCAEYERNKSIDEALGHGNQAADIAADGVGRRALEALPELLCRIRDLEDAAKFEAKVAKKLSDPFWNYAVAERYFELALPYRRLPAAVLLKAARLEVEADMIREGKGPGSPEEE